MTKLASDYTTPAPSRDTFNPYAHAARIRREARALLASPSTAVRDPFANVDDDAGFVGSTPRPSAMLRAEGGAS